MNCIMNFDNLAREGYQVVRGVLNEEEVALAKRLWLEWYEANGLGRYPVPPHGVIPYWQVGHTSAAWYIRTHPAVRGVFERLWGDRNLVVSFDGACYYPPELRRKNSSQGWIHVDQGGEDIFKCVQGFVALTDNVDATLGVVPRSHLDFAENIKRNGGTKANFVKMAHYTAQDLVRVPAQAGDLVIWDSRVAHQNFYGENELRLVQYVSYLPRRGARTRDLEKRLINWRNKRTTTHWAYPPRVNGLQPNNRGGGGFKIDYTNIVDPGEWVFSEYASEINKLI